jgi:hypothetical protein
MFNLRFATSSDQLEDKTAFEKEARSVISLMQLPLTGVFNRLTLSVCRATIDTQVTFSRVFLPFNGVFHPPCSHCLESLPSSGTAARCSSGWLHPASPCHLLCSSVVACFRYDIMSHP